MTFPRVRNGFGVLTADVLNRLLVIAEWAEDRMQTGDPKRPDDLRPPYHVTFLARKTGENDASPKEHQWEQADIDQSADSFITKVVGKIRTSEVAGDSGTSHTNYALNTSENDVDFSWVPIGGILWMHAAHGDDGGIKYWFTFPNAAPIEFFARVISVDGPFDNKWLYTCTQQRATGIDANLLVQWEDDPDGQTVAASNPLEDGNNAAGTVAPGINLANLPGTFSLQPIGSDDGPIVLVRELQATDETSVFVIIPQSNTADGPCP